MIISHQHRFILLSPWKCASSTCHATLEGYNESPYDRFFDFNPHLNRVVHQHATLAHVLALPEGKLGYRMATFVRNPYDRAYSGFLQIQRDAANQPRFHYAVPWIGDLVRAQVALNMERMIAAGFEFDRWLELLPDYEVFDAARNTNMPLHPAHYWTHVGGKMMIDFLGRVEISMPTLTVFVRWLESNVRISSLPINRPNRSRRKIAATNTRPKCRGDHSIGSTISSRRISSYLTMKGCEGGTSRRRLCPFRTV